MTTAMRNRIELVLFGIVSFGFLKERRQVAVALLSSSARRRRFVSGSLGQLGSAGAVESLTLGEEVAPGLVSVIVSCALNFLK
jgi:hypothetical protein